MKKKYENPEVSIISTSLRLPILQAGSQTDVRMRISNVNVQEFEQGFEISGNDFKDISFD